MNMKSGKNDIWLYRPSIEPQIDAVLKHLGLIANFKTTWWNVVDVLFEHNYLQEAQLAQRQAVRL